MNNKEWKHYLKSIQSSYKDEGIKVTLKELNKRLSSEREQVIV